MERVEVLARSNGKKPQSINREFDWIIQEALVDVRQVTRKKAHQNTRHHYDTLVSSKTEIVGDLHFTGGLHVDGKVLGCVIAADDPAAVVRISDHGVIEGEVRAPNIIINGQVMGDVYSSEHVELAANAVVNGTVHYNLIEMVMGAQVNGSLVHGGEHVQEAIATKNMSSAMNQDSETPSIVNS